MTGTLIPDDLDDQIDEHTLAAVFRCKSVDTLNEDNMDGHVIARETMSTQCCLSRIAGSEHVATDTQGIKNTANNSPQKATMMA